MVLPEGDGWAYGEFVRSYFASAASRLFAERVQEWRFLETEKAKLVVKLAFSRLEKLVRRRRQLLSGLSKKRVQSIRVAIASAKEAAVESFRPEFDTFIEQRACVPAWPLRLSAPSRNFLEISPGAETDERFAVRSLVAAAS
jgi:hypothetical protein